MRRMIACLLALLLTMSLAVCVAAEETAAGYVNPDDVYSATEVVGEADGTSGQGELDSVEIKQYADDPATETVPEVEIEQYAEEETGFWAWLNGIWNSILKFFGL